MQTDERTATPEPRSRLDHRTGKRVRIYDASFWQMHIAERRRLGQSVHTYCTAQGLALSTFRRWAQRLDGCSKGSREPRSMRKGDAKVAFLKVPLGDARDETAAESMLEVTLGSGVRMKLSGGAALQVVSALLVCVERAAQS